MPYKYELLLEGNRSESLLNSYNSFRQIDETLEASDLVELRLEFSTVFPGFENQANSLNSILEATGVKKWPGNDRLVYTDKSTATWCVRWKHGNPWTLRVFYIVIGLGIAVLAFLLFWKLYKVTETFMAKYPEAASFIVLGLLIAGIYAILRKTGG